MLEMLLGDGGTKSELAVLSRPRMDEGELARSGANLLPPGTDLGRYMYVLDQSIGTTAVFWSMGALPDHLAAGDFSGVLVCVSRGTERYSSSTTAITMGRHYSRSWQTGLL